jgi:hypothetical protein
MSSSQCIGARISEEAQLDFVALSCGVQPQPTDMPSSRCGARQGPYPPAVNLRMRKRSIEHLRKGHAVLARSHGGAKFTGSEGIGRRHDVPGARSSSQKIAAAAVELAPSEVCVLVRELVVRIETRLHTASVKILKTACGLNIQYLECPSKFKCAILIPLAVLACFRRPHFFQCLGLSLLVQDVGRWCARPSSLGPLRQITCIVSKSCFLILFVSVFLHRLLSTLCASTCCHNFSRTWVLTSKCGQINHPSPRQQQKEPPWGRFVACIYCESAPSASV